MSVITLTTEQVNRLCKTLGIDVTTHHTQRIVIDIACDRTVHAYTMSLLQGNQLTQLFDAVAKITPTVPTDKGE
jgi:hypothetical protein